MYYSILQESQHIATGINSLKRSEAIKAAFNYVMNGKYSKMSISNKENHLNTLGFIIDEHETKLDEIQTFFL